MALTLFQLNSVTIPAVWDFIQANDAILLKGDACYLVLQQRQWPTTNVFVLATDVQSRGLVLTTDIVALSDQQWVSLTLTYQRVLNCL